MKKRIAIAFAGLVLMLTASFAPIAEAPVPGCDIYVTMGGNFDARLIIYVNTMFPNSRLGFAIPFNVIFGLKPMHLLENICFGAPIDVGGTPGPEIIPITKEQINPIVHYVAIGPPLRPTLTFWRMTLFSPAPGAGVIFLKGPGDPFAGDVDCYTENFDAGVFWTPPSPLAGQIAAMSGGHYKMCTGAFVPDYSLRFPVLPVGPGGVDGIPGTGLWYGPYPFGGQFDQDGFGDGVPDPAGSSILMLPLMLLGDEWNATSQAWEPTIMVPMPLVLTTGVAFDHVAEAASFLFCTNSTEVGLPWENLSLGAPWDDPKAFIKVVYVCAWSNLLYSLNPDDDCPPDCTPDPEAVSNYYYTADVFWEYVEKKVRQDCVIADINCDQCVNIQDIVIAALAFGSHDVGLGPDGLPLTADDWFTASPNWDPRGDLTCDSIVNICDLVRIAIDFGKCIDPQ